MIKFSTIFLLSLMTGSIYAQSRMADQAPVSQVAKASSSVPALTSYQVSSSSYDGSVSKTNSYSGRMDDNPYQQAEANASSASYHSTTEHNHFGRVLYANSSTSLATASSINESSSFLTQRLALPKHETALLVFKTEPLTVNGKASNNEFRHLGFDYLVGVFPATQTNDPPLSGNGNSTAQSNFMNPFFQSNPQCQSSDYNKTQFSYTCPLTGLSTGYLSNHRCNGCVGYYHYWRTYTNFGCFEYLNGQINKVQSVDELKTLIQSYYDCIDYYQQYNFLDPNTRARYRYGVGH